MINVEVRGLKELEKALSEFTPQMEKKALRKAIGAAAKVFRNEARNNAPRKTGKLRRSIRSEVKKSSMFTYEGRVGPAKGMRYGHLVEFGTKPHEIVTKQKRMLANIKTGIVFGRKVRHPGMAGKPFLTPAFDGGHMRALDAFRYELEKFVNSYKATGTLVGGI